MQKLLEKISVDKLALIDELEEEYQIVDDQTCEDIRDLENLLKENVNFAL